MKIDFVRTGGFAGLRLALSVDTDNLESEQASELETLVYDADFFDLPSRRADPTGAADRFQFRLRISSSIRGHHQVTLPEAAVPERLLPLLNRLTALALDQFKNYSPPSQTV